MHFQVKMMRPPWLSRYIYGLSRLLLQQLLEYESQRSYLQMDAAAVAALVYCGLRSEHLKDHKVLIHGGMVPQIAVTKDHNIWNVLNQDNLTSIWFPTLLQWDMIAHKAVFKNQSDFFNYCIKYLLNHTILYYIWYKNAFPIAKIKII